MDNILLGKCVYACGERYVCMHLCVSACCECEIRPVQSWDMVWKRCR